MKKKFLAVSLVTYALMLSGCSLNARTPGNEAVLSELEISEDNEVNENIEEDVKPLTMEDALKKASESGEYSSDVIRMLELELIKQGAGLSEEEYYEIAGLYEKLGLNLTARDTLEEIYKLTLDDKYIELLEGLFINLNEESDTVQNMAGKLRESLMGIGEEKTYSEAISIIDSDEWINTMMPFKREGTRNYFNADNGEVNYIIQTGFNKVGDKEIYIYIVEVNKGIALSLSGNNLTVYEETAEHDMSITDILSGTDKKSYEKIVTNTENQTITSEIGSYENGHLMGEYLASVVSGKYTTHEELYTNKDNLKGDYYKGIFDEEGKTKVETLGDKNIASLKKLTDSETVIAYAYNDSKNKCLFLGVTKDEQKNGVTFTKDFIEVIAAPKVKTYEPVARVTLNDIAADIVTTQTVNQDDIKVRVYNGNIEIFNGSSWISYGTVAELSGSDPLAMVNEQIEEAFAANKEGNTKKETGSMLQASIGSNKTVTVTSSKPQTTTKPQASVQTKPQAESTPQATTPAPQPSYSEPQPSTPTSQPSTPAPQPSTPTQEPEPTPPPENNSGSDNSESESGSGTPAYTDDGSSVIDWSQLDKGP